MNRRARLQRFDPHLLKWKVRRWFPWLVPLHRAVFAWRTARRTHEAIFGDIFEKRWWGGKETVSGLGSRVEANQTLIAALPRFFEEYTIKTVLDAPCGDFNWMSRVDLDAVQYLGVDIVPKLLDANSKRYRRQNVGFQLLDVLTAPIPQVDMIICKDLMIHLSNHQVQELIENFCVSRSRFLLATTAVQSDVVNTDIPTGYFRRINLMQPPFSLPEPICLIPSDTPQWSDPNGLWELKQLRKTQL